MEQLIAPPPVAKKRVDIRRQLQQLCNGLCSQVHVKEMSMIVSKVIGERSPMASEKEKLAFMTLCGLIAIVGERNVKIKSRSLSPVGSLGKPLYYPILESYFGELFIFVFRVAFLSFCRLGIF